MENNSLSHHGVKGMKWGQRLYQNKDGTLTALGRRRYDKELAKAKEGIRIQKNKARTQAKIDKLTELQKQARGEMDDAGVSKSKSKKAIDTPTKKQSVKSMSDDEIKTKLERLQLEREYLKEVKNVNADTASKGKTFVMKILEKSGEDVLTQFTKYLMGNAINKAFEEVFNDPKIVNPKKGQKKDS